VHAFAAADRLPGSTFAQDAFYTAFRTLHHLRTPRLFAAWLYRIVATARAMADRRDRRVPPLLPLDALEKGPRPPAAAPPDLTRLLLQQTLAALTATERTILVMDGVWGLSEKEIAAALGVSPAAARKRLQRAKGRFRARYPRGEDDS